MKTKSMMPAGMLVFLAGLVPFGATMMAQIRPALVRNIDEPGRSPYQSARNCTSSGQVAFCGGQFATIPLGKRLVVQHVSLAVSCNQAPCMDSPLVIGTAGQLTQEDPGVYLLPSSSRQGFLDQNILLYVEPGNTPAFGAYFNQVGGTMKITLTGYLVDLSQ